MNSRNRDALIKRAIAQALEADGEPLDWTMPRWYWKAIISLQKKGMGYAERSVNAMQLNRLYLLEAQ